MLGPGKRDAPRLPGTVALRVGEVSKERLHTHCALMPQQPRFAFHPSTISSKRSIRPDHTMARHNHGNRVRAVRQAHSSHRGRPADPFRQLPVGNRSTAWNPPQFQPNLLLKLRPLGVHRQLVNCVQLAREIPRDRARCAQTAIRRFQPVSPLPILPLQPAFETRPVVSKMHGTQIPCPVLNNLQPANWSIELVEKQFQSRHQPALIPILTPGRAQRCGICSGPSRQRGV
jgi:hypothetical protein